MTRAAFVVAIVIASFLLPSPAAGQSETCGDRDTVIKNLGERYAEFPVLWAHSDNYDSMLEFFGQENGTWTLIITRNGKTCGVDAGEWWALVPPPPPKTESSL